ncbi:MAG TPA: 4Fe-4S dicluster domain-containing protein [Leadbetterella sp.]|nr:4Fe-4S dicluster domain-containing protein [Leadbetterella sp.]
MTLYLHMAYFQNIKRGIKTTTKGLRLTLKHIWAARKTKGPLNVQDENYFKISEGFVTLQYPHEQISVPDIGRYQLDCEIDDCIVCDKCAKICPVDCIEIEAIKSPELIRTTSDGSPVRLHAAKFDIDMAKCCFCGLCTTVCPTECLTMNSEYDYSVLDVSLLNMAFSNLSAAEAQEKRNLYEQFVAEKEAAKAAKTEQLPKSENVSAFKPKAPSAFQPKPPAEAKELENNAEPVKKPVFAPKKPAVAENKTIEPEIPLNQELVKPKPIFTPKKPIASGDQNASVQEPLKESSGDLISVSEKPQFIAKKPIQGTASSEITEESKPKFTPTKPAVILDEALSVEKPKFVPKRPQNLVDTEKTVSEKPKFVPKKPVTTISEPDYSISEEPSSNIKPEPTLEAAKPTGFVPKLKPVATVTETATSEIKKTVFVPKNKPEAAPNEDRTPSDEDISPTDSSEIEKPVAKFVPKLKPKS